MMFSRRGLREILALAAGGVIMVSLLCLMAMSYRFTARHLTAPPTVAVRTLSPMPDSPVDGRPATEVADDIPQRMSDLLPSPTPSIPSVVQDDVVVRFNEQSLKGAELPHFDGSGQLVATVAQALPQGFSVSGRHTPQALFVAGAVFPETLIRAGVTEGEALLLIRIDESGRCTVVDVIEISHPELLQPTVSAAERSLFQIPRQDGRIVPRHLLWPVAFRADEERVKAIRSNVEH